MWISKKKTASLAGDVAGLQLLNDELRNKMENVNKLRKVADKATRNSNDLVKIMETTLQRANVQHSAEATELKKLILLSAETQNRENEAAKAAEARLKTSLDARLAVVKKRSCSETSSIKCGIT